MKKRDCATHAKTCVTRDIFQTRFRSVLSFEELIFKASSMKTLFFLVVSLFLSIWMNGQNTTQFRESTYLLRNENGTFSTIKGDTKVILKIRKKSGVTLKRTGISVTGTDTIQHFSESMNFINRDFIASDFNLENQERLYGDLVQEGEVIKFYPWMFKWNDEGKAINDSLNKHGPYLIEIPHRTTVRARYNAYHFGTLTLPVKFYLKKEDSISNTEFDANINFMVGKKWGSKKFRYVADELKESYTVATSLNLITGISKLTLTPSNTEQDLTKDIDVASLSYGVAVGFQYKKVGVFAALGFDTPLSRFGKEWVYREVPWLGFGIGLGL